MFYGYYYSLAMLMITFGGLLEIKGRDPREVTLRVLLLLLLLLVLFV